MECSTFSGCIYSRRRTSLWAGGENSIDAIQNWKNWKTKGGDPQKVVEKKERIREIWEKNCRMMRNRMQIPKPSRSSSSRETVRFKWIVQQSNATIIYHWICKFGMAKFSTSGACGWIYVEWMDESWNEGNEEERDKQTDRQAGSGTEHWTRGWALAERGQNSPQRSDDDYISYFVSSHREELLWTTRGARRLDRDAYLGVDQISQLKYWVSGNLEEWLSWFGARNQGMSVNGRGRGGHKTVRPAICEMPRLHSSERGKEKGKLAGKENSIRLPIAARSRERLPTGTGNATLLIFTQFGKSGITCLCNVSVQIIRSNH